MFKLTLVTPEKKVMLDQEVDEVIIPAFSGELDILPGHAPLLTTVEPGAIKIKLKGQASFLEFATGNGYCQIYSGGVNVLSETIESADEINIERSKKAFSDADRQLNQETLNDEEYLSAVHKKQRAQARLLFAKTQ